MIRGLITPAKASAAIQCHSTIQYAALKLLTLLIETKFQMGVGCKFEKLNVFNIKILETLMLAPRF
jgi:hypothetical protein